MEGLELICFKIIASVGEARNSLLNAYRHAKRKNVEEAKKCMQEAEEFFNKAHQAHAVGCKPLVKIRSTPQVINSLIACIGSATQSNARWNTASF